MKKIILTFCFTVAFSAFATTASAWTHCVKDVLYTTTYEVDFNPATGTLVGKSYFPDNLTPFGPISGFVNNGIATFTISYLLGESRTYEVNVGTLAGKTVAATTASVIYDDRPAALAMCIPGPGLVGPLGGSGSGASQ